MQDDIGAQYQVQTRTPIGHIIDSNLDRKQFHCLEICPSPNICRSSEICKHLPWQMCRGCPELTTDGLDAGTCRFGNRECCY